MKKNYLRYIAVVMFFMMCAIWAGAQINNPVTWNYTAVKIADKTYEIHLTASIGSTWRMYAQDTGTGPDPTTINFITNPLISFDGKVKEVGKLEKYYDKNFKSESKYYAKDVDFIQKVKIRSSIATVVAGTVNYVVCNDRQCLPPRDASFSINVGGK